MNFIDKLERKFGKYATDKMPFILIACYALGYMIEKINYSWINYLTLNPYLILKGQVWRLVSWILIPPSESNVFFVLIMLFFYYSISMSLVKTWGVFKYNLYIVVGLLCSIIGCFICMGVCYLFVGDVIETAGASYFFQIGSQYFSTFYVNMSILLAYAATFPNAMILMFFIIPLKVKWLGFFEGAIILYNLIVGVGNPYHNIFFRFGVISALLNFGLFMLLVRGGYRMRPSQIKRRMTFERETNTSRTIAKHKCAICGRTDETNPELEFRFCSRCNGNYEYCSDHLFSHKHVE
ncbi:MAG: hypothetical protein J5537_11640 [Lachnospiraceae bacterium]|nr:hypothetical protein [Lachnospiraceae bacterium]